LQRDAHFVGRSTEGPRACAIVGTSPMPRRHRRARSAVQRGHHSEVWGRPCNDIHTKSPRAGRSAVRDLPGRGRRQHDVGDRLAPDDGPAPSHWLTFAIKTGAIDGGRRPHLERLTDNGWYGYPILKMSSCRPQRTLRQRCKCERSHPGRQYQGPDQTDARTRDAVHGAIPSPELPASRRRRTCARVAHPFLGLA
jgi:hypothetical protein